MRRGGGVPGYEAVCATCHFAVASTMVLAWPALFDSRAAWAWLLLVPWIIVKEFGWDFWYEHDTWAGSLVDSFWYLAGGSVASVACWIVGRL